MLNAIQIEPRLLSRPWSSQWESGKARIESLDYYARELETLIFKLTEGKGYSPQVAC